MQKFPLHFVIHHVVRHHEENSHHTGWTMEDSWTHVTELFDIGYDLTVKEYDEYIELCKQVTGKKV